jgi:anti-sigma regulatory factor (Ser/Thr protein kinase)
VGRWASVGSHDVLELSLHVLDVLENAVEAGATRIKLRIEEDFEADRLVIEVVDNGRGMDENTLARVLDPFFTTRRTRHVGLGLPLFAAAAERCNGWLHVGSQVGQGTRVIATFQHSHIDRAPLGDLRGALLAFLMTDRPVDLHYAHRVNGRTFEFDTGRLRDELGGAPLTLPAVRRWLAKFIAEGEDELEDAKTGREMVYLAENDS